jgi:hypothetical protein
MQHPYSMPRVSIYVRKNFRATVALALQRSYSGTMSTSSSKHDPVGSVNLTGRMQLPSVQHIIHALRISRSSVSSPKLQTRKLLPAIARAGHTSDRNRDNVLIYRVDPGDRGVPPRSELIKRVVAQRITWRAEYDKALLAAAPAGEQQSSPTGQKGQRP